MDSKFSIDLRHYAVVPLECMDCHAKNQQGIRLDHSGLAQKVNHKISMRCPECSRVHWSNIK